MLTPDELEQRLAARTRAESAARLRPAGVLVALSQRTGEQGPRVLFIKRPDHMRTHGGQYAFPGGARDAIDESVVATALREASEEVGLAPVDVRVLGLLDDTATISGYLVTPVVGWIPAGYAFRASADEVAEIAELPVSGFTQGPPRAHVVPGEGFRRIVLAYEVEGRAIWGATASILTGFSRVIAS